MLASMPVCPRDFNISGTRTYLGLSSRHWCRVWCYRRTCSDFMDMLRRLISCRIISIIITAAGLLQCSVGWHSTTPCTALAIGDERGRTTRLRVIKVRSPHAAPRQLHWLKVPWRIDYKLAVLVYKCLHGLAPSYLADELHHPAMFEIRKRLRSALSYELSIPRTRLSTYGDRAFHSCSRRCADLEQSSTAYHICSVTSRLLLSLEDTLLRTLLPVITVVVPAKWHCHLWTR